MVKRRYTENFLDIWIFVRACFSYSNNAKLCQKIQDTYR